MKSNLKIQLRISLVIFGMIVLVAIANKCYGQKRKEQQEKQKFIYPEFIEAGRTVNTLTSFLKSKGKSNPYFSKVNGGTYDISYQYMHDLRIDGKMYLSSYDYFFKNDTCVAIKIKPGSSIPDWKSEVEKNHNFVEDEKKGDMKTIHKYLAKDGSYSLWAIETVLNTYDGKPTNVDIGYQAFLKN